MASGFSGGEASLEALRRSNEANFEALKKKQDELAREHKASRDADKGRLKQEIKKYSSHLASPRSLFFAYLIAIAGDTIFSLLLNSGTLVGYLFDGVIIIILSTLTKTALLKDLRMSIFYIPELIPLVEFFPFYTLAVAFYHFRNRDSYGSLSDLLKAKKEFSNEGIFSGTSINLTGFGVWGVVLMILIPGCIVMDLSSTEYQPSNIIGNTAQNIPIYKALKEGGRVADAVDRTTVEAFNWNYNYDPLGWVQGMLNRSSAIAGNNYYEGEIEETQGLNLGLEVSDIEFLYYQFAGDPIEFSYFVTGGTFTKTGKIAKPYCYIKKPNLVSSNELSGRAQPSEIFLIKDLPVAEIIFCSFDSNNLEPGYYQAFAGVEYDFEVWSYIPYTFVSQSTFEAYGQDINTRLNIDRKTNSLNTDGPVVLTISELAQNIPQPYIVREDRDSNFLVNFKLENNQRGSLKSLDYVILQVPKEFDANCFRQDDKWEQNSDRAKKILEQQIIESEESSNRVPDLSFLDEINPIILFDFTEQELKNPQLNFRCSLTLDSQESFLSPGTQTKKTIVATAKYSYRVEQVSTLQLNERPQVVS